MVLTSGLITHIRSDVKEDLSALLLYGAIGDDDTAADASDTSLGSENFRDSIDEFDDSAADKVVVSLRVMTTEGNGNDVNEVGFLDSASGGSLFSRNIINTISKTSDKQLFLDLEITIGVSEE